MTTMLEERKETKVPVRDWFTFPTFGEPFMHRFMNDMERVFDDFAVGTGMRTPRDEVRRMTIWTPRIEAFMKEGQFIVRAELPGLKKEDVKLEMTDEAMTIEGERKMEKEEKREGYFFAERTYGNFYRWIPLPEGSKFEAANAVFKDGVLEVTIPVPKLEPPKTKRLEIKAV
jgi:HSP20 family protein